MVTLEVDDGFHVNANPASFDYLIPTSVTFDRLQPLRIDYPKPVRFKSAFAPDGLDVYEGVAALVADFPKDALKAGDMIRSEVPAQACNQQTCLPPSNFSLSIRIPTRQARPVKGLAYLRGAA